MRENQKTNMKEEVKVNSISLEDGQTGFVVKEEGQGIKVALVGCSDKWAMLAAQLIIAMSEIREKRPVDIAQEIFIATMIEDLSRKKPKSAEKSNHKKCEGCQEKHSNDEKHEDVLDALVRRILGGMFR